MTVQTSGPISLNDVNIEVGRSSGAVARLNNDRIRVLAGATDTGSVSLGDCYGCTMVVVTQGSQSVSQAAYYGFSNNGVSMGSRTPTNVTGNSLSNMSIRRIARINSSAGVFINIEVDYSSSNAIDVDEFTSFSFVANGTVTTLSTSEASATMVGGGFIRRWSWSSSYGLDSTELSNINSEWDGSGTVRVGFKP